MNPFTQTALAICASFSAYMAWAAFRVKKAVKRQSHSGRAVHLVLLFSSFFMCFTRFPHWGILNTPIIPSTPLFGWLGVGVCAVGFAFCFWARQTLGGNWSGAVTLKEGHELIQKGPYALSRHPMYTGILTGLLGAALTAGQVGNFLGVALLAFAMIRKMGMEESYLRSHFGTDYDDYSRKAKRLIPFVY
jgi:protein-S-isoprenylcysteine O-methyltransferase Ste14